MINHHAILRQELKRIANNINKKYSVLRKEILKTSEVFDNDNIPVFPYEVCFGLYRQITQTGSLSSSLAFFTFFQNIINLGFANEDMSREILSVLANIKSIPKFQCLENQVKLQHICILLISRHTISLQKLGFTHSLINLLISLENTKYKVLWMRTTAALVQILLLMTNDIADQQTEKKIHELDKFLNDLIQIVVNDPPQWLIEFADPYIILQVLCQILDEKYFLEHASRHKQALQKMVDPVRKQIRKVFDSVAVSNKSEAKFWELNSENRLLILIRIGCKLNRLVRIGFEYLEEIIKIISDKSISNLKVIGYEAINYLFRDPSWMNDLLESEYTELFNFLLTTEFNTVKYILMEYKDRIDLHLYYSWQENNFNKILGCNSIDIGMHEFTFSQQVKIIIKNIEEITYGLYSIYGQYHKINFQVHIEGKPPQEKTYKFCQKTVFEMIKAIIGRDMSEDTLQSILKIAEKFINLSGCFNDSNVSNMYIKLMCKYCLPAQFKNIGHRHVQINKMILNTANCLGNLFTTNCWVTVWKALQNYSMYYNRYLLGKEELQAARESDVQILYKSMDSIFTETPKYDDKYLLEVLRSLIEVTYECLENNYSDEARKIFAFERIEQVYKLNLYRICIIWPELSSSLLCITTSKVMYFRTSALGLLNVLIPRSLNYLKNNPQNLREPFTIDNYQSLILEPWMNLVDCQFPEIKNQLVVAVNKLIIDYGHIMTHGWKCILEVVSKTNDLKSLQTIVETFLEKVNDSMMNVLLIVDNIERKLEDTNQKYLCLTMIWSIADYSSKIEQRDVLRKIYQILLKPEEMFNLGTEARHSSFYIFAELIVHNCTEKSEEFWKWIFGEVDNFCAYGFDQCLQSPDKQFAEEAIKNIITNLIKIYKKIFIVSKEWESDALILQLLSKFYMTCSRVLQFRNPQLYQSLIKQIKEILYTKSQQSLNLPEFYTFLETITQIYFVQSDNKILKCLITYIPADIFDILSHCFAGLEGHFNVIYKLIEKIFLLRLQALEKEIKLQQLRIFFQQRPFFQMIKKMHAYINEEVPTLVPIYIENLIKTLHKLKLYEDYVSVTKILPYLTNTTLKYLDANLQMTLELYREIVNSRKEEGWIKNWSLSKDIPIWYVAIQDLMKLSFAFLQSTKIKSAEIIYNILLKILMQEQISFSSSSQECISYFYESEIQISHFLIENYIFNEKIPFVCKEDIQSITEKLAKRSEQYKNNDPIKKGQNAYELLFKLCHKREKIDENHVERQIIIVQQLYQRISKTFANYFQRVEETIEQMKYVLKKMYSLEIFPGILRKSKKLFESRQNIDQKSNVFELTKSHLFYFQCQLAKCIKTQDQQLQEILIDIFQKTGELLLKPNKQS